MDFENQASKILKLHPLNITLLQKTKNAINSQAYFSLIASNKSNIMIIKEDVQKKLKFSLDVKFWLKWDDEKLMVY